MDVGWIFMAPGTHDPQVISQVSSGVSCFHQPRWSLSDNLKHLLFIWRQKGQKFSFWEGKTDGTELHHQGEQLHLLFKHFLLFLQPLKHSLLGLLQPLPWWRHHSSIHTSIRYWLPPLLKSTVQPLMKPHEALIIVITSGVSTATRYN